jgi:hypothetical protein
MTEMRRYGDILIFDLGFAIGLTTIRKIRQFNIVLAFASASRAGETIQYARSKTKVSSPILTVRRNPSVLAVATFV